MGNMMMMIAKFPGNQLLRPLNLMLWGTQRGEANPVQLAVATGPPQL
jgi:hypothetical protein